MTQREELIEQLRQLARTEQPLITMPGACCYAIAPPDPTISRIANFISSKISEFFNGEQALRLRPKTSQIPAMLDQYNDAFERLRNVGLDVTLEVPKNWQDKQKLQWGDKFYMILRFPNDDTPQKIQLPNLIFIEAMIDFLQTGSEESQRVMHTLFGIDLW
jgi:hypothetical protein